MHPQHAIGCGCMLPYHAAKQLRRFGQVKLLHADKRPAKRARMCIPCCQTDEENFESVEMRGRLGSDIKQEQRRWRRTTFAGNSSTCKERATDAANSIPCKSAHAYAGTELCKDLENQRPRC